MEKNLENFVIWNRRVLGWLIYPLIPFTIASMIKMEIDYCNNNSNDKIRCDNRSGYELIVDIANGKEINYFNPWRALTP
ncbi:MAG: hypothetical protein AABX84_02565 [Nanoarchaeota archaeon]